MSAPKPIGIAVVEHQQRYLVGVRGPDVPLAGFAEFPGGKCGTNESPADCAVRECLEESGLTVTVKRLLTRIEFEYPHGRVDLHFFLCHPANPEDVAERHHAFWWATTAELRNLTFPEANAGIIRFLGDPTSGAAQTN